MAFTPFDFNEAIAQRREHASEGLRYGSPVVGVSCARGLFLLTVRRSQRKVFEIYDRLIYSAIGNQSDIESVRLGAVDLAAREGFDRSPDDVTAQRLVGFSLSPALKEVFRDQFRAPSVIRALFGELGDTPEQDVFFTLNYDGEFRRSAGAAAIAGTEEIEEQMTGLLSAMPKDLPFEDASQRALTAWGTGALRARDRGPRDDDVEEDSPDPERVSALIAEEICSGQIEVGLLDRDTKREARFTLLPRAEVERIEAPYRQDRK